MAVLDLAEIVTAADLVGLVITAVQSTRSARQLRRRLAQRDHVAQRSLLTALLADVEVGVESPLELRYLRDVERAHGLPSGDWQHHNSVGHRRDVRYRTYAVVVELDGRLGHEGMGRFRDMTRDNDNLMAGEVTLRFGHVDILERSCLVAWQVGALLVARGWPGAPALPALSAGARVWMRSCREYPSQSHPE